MMWHCPAHGAEVSANLALGKPYTLSPAPDYRLCTDAGDRTQLTDGNYTTGYFWTQRGTVGWIGRGKPVVITIDLQHVEPIGGISYSTAAGVAGVQWPLSILVLTSDDGRQYHLAGDLVTLDADEHHTMPPAGKYGRHRYQSHRLATQGRYVTLLIPAASYVFADEIEVYRGDNGLLSTPPRGPAVTSFEAVFHQTAVANGVARRLREDLAAVRNELDSASLSEQYAAELKSIDGQIAHVTVKDPAHFRTVLPLNAVDRRIFALQAAAWRADGIEGVRLWQTGRWDPLSPTQAPGKAGASIDVDLMRGEYRGAAFNLSNAGDQPIALHLSIRGIGAEAIHVHESPFTDTKSGVPVAAALVPANRDGDGWKIEIEPGMTRQVWLTFHAVNMPAGTVSGRIDITPGDLHVPVRLRVYPLDFPAKTTLNLTGWAYTDELAYQITDANRDAFIAQLKSHFVNAPTARNGTLAPGSFDETGRMTVPPDTTRCDQWLARWPDARTYFVFMSFEDRFASFERNSPAWRNALAAWIHFWVDHLRSRGIEPNRLALLLVDEPHTHEQDHRIIDYARAIAAAAPSVVIWEDPTWTDPTQATPGLFTVADVLCPNMVHLIAKGKPFADFYKRQQKAGRRLWLYACSGPGRLLDPYAYERMQAWFCLQLGAVGEGFWAFGDSNGASSWNEYLTPRGAYTPLFIDDRTITPGKHMEAIREGVEDYETLRMLRDRVDALTTSGRDNADLAAARKLLADGPNRVTSMMTNVKMIQWHQPKDRTIADQVRLEALNLLLRLSREH